ncbi:choice-of-anchor K domain-containing protein [Floridanema evergladense]|uniref:Choice-of-anchor K domain-containing protein n=1 Tax=Floridaenema evergladense BLCC-F167 TaxID=3153639 RepID=A0ABV4WYN9_9CYAN
MGSRITQLSTGLLAATVLFTLASQAQAITFSGRSSGEWGMPTNPSGSTVISSQNGGTNNRLSWGRTDNCGGSCTPFNNYVQYDNVSFNAEVNALFNIGNFSYRNGSVWDAFDGDFPLSLSLFLINPFSSTRNFNFLFNILNTPNTTENPVLDGDRLRFSTAGLSSESFNYDGVDYTLELVGFSTDGGRTIVNEFNSPEGSIASASLYGKITAIIPPTQQSVPEPASTLGLLALGVLGAGSMLNRKQQQKA